MEKTQAQQKKKKNKRKKNALMPTVAKPFTMFMACTKKF